MTQRPRQRKPAKKSPAPTVLLVEPNASEAELYSDLIRESATVDLDVLNRISSDFDWLAQSRYNLIVLDVAALKTQSADLVGEGMRVLEEIKRQHPETAVILVTEYASIEQAVTAMRLGAEDFFRKPVNFESFKLAVRRALDRKAVWGDIAVGGEYLNLLTSCQMISASLDRERVLQIVRAYFVAELDVKHSALYRSDGKGKFFPDERDTGLDPSVEEMIDIALSASSPFPRMVQHDEMCRFVDRGKLTPAYFVFRYQDPSGRDLFLVGLSPKKPKDESGFLERLRMLKRQVELTAKNISQYEGVQSLVFKDDATGLYNTRYLNYVLDREILKSQQSKKAFAVLFIDADHFKKVNDEYGHIHGTQLLNEMGAHLKRCVRDRDIVFRYGGDEFIAVLVPSDLETARMVAERIRRSVEETAFLDGLGVHVTVSIGVALYPDHAVDKTTIIHLADQAMYMAKRQNRNCVEVLSREKAERILAEPAKAPATPAGASDQKN